MMQKTWQLVKIELRRKWPFVAVLLALWLSACLALRLWLPHNYLFLTSGWENILMLLFPPLYALIFGVATFHTSEKDGVRFFLYHHPVSRVRLYVVRYLVGFAIVAILSVVVVWLTPHLLQMPVRSAFLGAKDFAFLLACLFIYTAGIFFSPLFATDLVAVPIAAMYCGLCGAAVALLGKLTEPDLNKPGQSQWELLMRSPVFHLFAGLLVFVFLSGLILFSRRRILEYSWSRRSNVAAAMFCVTAIALFLVLFVDPVDLLYLVGIDLMRWR